MILSIKKVNKMFYIIHKKTETLLKISVGVIEGARTPDPQNHNLML